MLIVSINSIAVAILAEYCSVQNVVRAPSVPVLRRGP
jgi:hypothetical protein